MRNESTSQLIKCFLEERKSCKSIREIANNWQLSTTTIYKVIIPEVSKATGISKNELLYFPGRGNPYGNIGYSYKEKPIDMAEFWEEHFTMLDKMKKIVEMEGEKYE